MCSISKRLAAVMGAIAIAAVAPLCGATAARAETVLRVGNVGEPASLDPHLVSGVWENRIIGDMFMGLMTEAADGTVVPGAAERWKVSDDGKVYTFELREHTWSDGTPVTAHDFVYSLRRILEPATAAEYASLLYPIRSAEALNTGKTTDATELGVRAVDDETLEITLESPTPFFLELLTHYTAYPVPKHAVEKHGNAWIKAGNIVSNGAYVLDEWAPGTHVKLSKNARFYDAANVKVDRIVFYPQEDRVAVQKRFRAGEIDYAADFASDQIDWLRKNMPDETWIAPYLGIYYYPINTRKPPFDDVRVRQALSMAIDREAITYKVMKTGELPAYSFVPPGTANYSEPAYVAWKDTPQAERATRAKALLAEAGFGSDNPLKFTLSYNTSENHKRIAIAVAAMWKQIGVEVELLNTDVKVHYDKLKQGDFDVARAGWIADYNDPQNFLYLLESSTGPLNYGGYSNAEFNRLMDEANTTVDLERRAALMREAEALAMADQPVIPIYYYVSKNLVQRYVKGWQPNTKDIHRSRFISIER